MRAEHSLPIVCYVTDRKAIDSSGDTASLASKIRSAISAGADWVQIREKDLNGRELLELARAAVASAQKEARTGAAPAARFARAPVSEAASRSTTGPTTRPDMAGNVVFDLARLCVPIILVNDRLDVALAAGAGGVHLGGQSVPAQEVVRWLRAGKGPANFLVGVSCHSVEDVRSAEDAGANYAFFGPVFDTPSKRRFRSPHGIARLEEACRCVNMPVIAIGGVNEQNGAECIRAGAAGVAAIRLFQQAGAAPKDAIERMHHLA